MTGGAGPTLRVYPDAAATTRAAAVLVVDRLLAVLADRHVAHAVLTGGGAGIQTLADVRQVAAERAADGAPVAWDRVHVWWGDERFLPSGDPDRNETQAREALLDHVPLRPDRVHPVPGPDVVADPDAAAAAYAATLAQHAAAGPDGTAGRSAGGGPAALVPRFDVLLLGMGPDGHTASLFPGRPDARVDDRTTIGVTGSPKPPPERVSLTMPAIGAADDVWFVVTGADKAPALARVVQGTDVDTTPAAGARGRATTLWLVDADAAREVESPGT